MNLFSRFVHAGPMCVALVRGRGRYQKGIVKTPENKLNEIII